MKTKAKHNIIILNHHASAPDTGGGGRHYELAKELSEEGNKVTVIASSYNNGKKQYDLETDLKITKITNINENFNFIRIKTKPAYTNTLTRFINYYDYMSKASKLNDFGYRPDVIIASSVHPLTWIAGYKLSKRYNAKFIVEVRDLWPLSMYEDFSGITRKLVFSYFESLERKHYGLADGIITTAPFAYEYMEEKYGTDKNKVHYIPHGLDIDEFDKNSQLNDETLDKELRDTLNNNFCVTYTGSLSKSEGLPTFVESAKYLKNISEMKLVIVGSGSEKRILEDIIKEEKLDNVIMVGRQSRDTMALTLTKSDILFCGLMEREAFKYGISKNKFYDYMAAEKPIIFASSVRGSLIDTAKAGVTIKPGDSENLANNIRKIYENIDTIGKQYGENGREYVEKNHTNKRIAEQFLNVIEACKSKSEFDG